MNKQEVLMRGKVFFKLGQINGNLRMKNIKAAQKNLRLLETMLGNCSLIPLEEDIEEEMDNALGLRVEQIEIDGKVEASGGSGGSKAPGGGGGNHE